MNAHENVVLLTLKFIHRFPIALLGPTSKQQKPHKQKKKRNQIKFH